MPGSVFVVVEHAAGKAAEVTFEMLGEGRKLADALGGSCTAVVAGKDLKEIAESCGVADTVLSIEHDALASFNPEGHAKAIAAVLKERAADVVIVSGTSKGMDIAPEIAAALGVPLVTNVGGITVDGGALVATSQVYGGKVSIEGEVEGGRGVLSVLAGAFPADAGRADRAATIEPATAGDLGELRIAFRELIEPEAADVDITKEEVLVSVGRGIQDEANIELVQELADAIGCPLSASRPIVDMGWLPKSRQVGKSGVTVKPKIYVAIGISGAPEHVQGMKDAATIVAINSDPKAPIFDFAHYGITADLFDVVPALTDKIKEAKGA